MNPHICALERHISDIVRRITEIWPWVGRVESRRDDTVGPMMTMEIQKGGSHIPTVQIVHHMQHHRHGTWCKQARLGASWDGSYIIGGEYIRQPDWDDRGWVRLGVIL